MLKEDPLSTFTQGGNDARFVDRYPLSPGGGRKVAHQECALPPGPKVCDGRGVYCAWRDRSNHRLREKVRQGRQKLNHLRMCPRFPRGLWSFVQGTSVFLDSEIIPSPTYTQEAM